MSRCDAASVLFLKSKVKVKMKMKVKTKVKTKPKMKMKMKVKMKVKMGGSIRQNSGGKPRKTRKNRRKTRGKSPGIQTKNQKAMTEYGE